MPDSVANVRRLAELVGVPAHAGPHMNWAEIEREAGLRLPADYKLLAESLPSGWVRRFVRFRKPERPVDGPQRLDGFSMAQLDTLREWRSEGHGQFPYPLFPEPGGLLPWGGVVAGGYAFWLTDPPDAPDDWPVVIASQDCDVWARFDGPVSEFLIEVAEARYDPHGFTEGPITVVFDESGQHKTAQPVVLTDRPVFEPDVTVSPPATPQLRVPPADFWVTRKLALGPRRAVNDLAALRELIGPPPADGGLDVDWPAVHERLGLALPSDYRGFIDAYGPGTLGNIRIMAPGAPGEMDLFELMERKYVQVRGLDRFSAGDAPFYPEPGGTVCWGEMTSGWTCGWAPAGADPEEWDVVAIMPTSNLRGFDIQGGLSFSTALKDYANRSPLGLLPSRDLKSRRVTFTPYK